MLERTHGVAGFFGASSMERLPTETALTATVRRFKSLAPSGGESLDPARPRANER